MIRNTPYLISIDEYARDGGRGSRECTSLSLASRVSGHGGGSALQICNVQRM